MTEKKSILITSEQIKNRIAELGDEISHMLAEENISDIIVLWLAEGAIFFASDLIRQIKCPNLQIRSLKASSYGKELFSQGDPKITGDESGFEGKNILIVDDIFDTGRTAEAICKRLSAIGAQSIYTCFLLNKKVEKTKKSPAAEESQSQTQMMSWVMLVMIIVMGFSLPVAMAIYWIISALISLTQSLIMSSINNKDKKNGKDGFANYKTVKK